MEDRAAVNAGSRSKFENTCNLANSAQSDYHTTVTGAMKGLVELNDNDLIIVKQVKGADSQCL